MQTKSQTDQLAPLATSPMVPGGANNNWFPDVAVEDVIDPSGYFRARLPARLPALPATPATPASE